MTDLVPYQAQSLVTWAQEADAAYVLAERMVATSFCPQQFRDKPAEAAAAVLAGAEVGLSPLASLRSFDIIQGTAAPRALTLRAIAQSAGCHFQTVEESDKKVVMRAKRPGGEWETVTWTIERAQKLGLTSKPNWQKQPTAMLVARATSDLARRVAADRILGLGYAAEEIDEEEQPTGKRTVSRKKAPAPDPASAWDEPKALEPGRDKVLRSVADVDLPPLPGEGAEDSSPAGPVRDERDKSGPLPRDTPPPVGEPEPQFPTREQDGGGVTPTGDRPGMITRSQSKRLFAMLRAQGVTERQDCLDFVNGLLGADIQSSTELTKGQASQVLDRLVQMEQATEDPEPGFDDEPHADEFVQLPYKDD